MKKKIAKSLFLENNLYGRNITFDDEFVYMTEERIKPYIKKYVLNYLGLVGGIILAIIILIMNSKRIKTVVFNVEYPVNDLIRKDICDNTKSFLSWRFLNKDITELNYEIKGKYPMYEWIGISKENNILYVEITNNKTKENDIQNINKNIIAKKDAIVKKYTIYEGTNKVTYNMNVKKGDILISNEVEATRGYVLGETYETKTVKISKKIIKKSLTGKMNNYYSLSLFGLDLKFNYHNDYQEYERREEKIFGHDKIIALRNIYIYEKSDIIDMYSKQEAKQLVYSYLDENFKKTLEDESILEVIYLNEDETKDDLIFRVLVKKIENIGEYE